MRLLIEFLFPLELLVLRFHRVIGWKFRYKVTCWVMGYKLENGWKFERNRKYMYGIISIKFSMKLLIEYLKFFKV